MKIIKRSALAGILGGVFSLSSYAQDVSDELKAPADVAAAPADAEKTTSGLAWKVLKKGDGTEHPRSFDTVSVHYTGWTTDGKMFDSSVKRGQPASFPLNGVIKGWTEGVQLMVANEKRRFWIPAELGYGENPGGGRPGGLLVFDIELLSITKGEEPPASAAPADAKKTDSGLAYIVEKEGEGEKPGASDIVDFHFAAWAPNGAQIQDSKKQGQPVSVPLDKIFPGFTEGLRLLSKGGKNRFWMPAKLAGPFARGMQPEEVLVVDLELLDFKKAPDPPKTPEDVAAAPEGAEKTESGISHRVLKKGTGTRKPKATDTVSVHYSGWQTDGKLFDSSVQRGAPTEFPLNGVIAGWTEGVQLMVEGEKRRFWIPADKAYGENPGGGRPGGTLVFDIELLKIVTPE